MLFTTVSGGRPAPSSIPLPAFSLFSQPLVTLPPAPRANDSVYVPEVFDDFDDVVFHFDGQEVGERGEHRADVFVGPVQRLAVVTHLQ